MKSGETHSSGLFWLPNVIGNLNPQGDASIPHFGGEFNGKNEFGEERIVRQLVMPPQHLMVRERHDGVPERLILALELLGRGFTIRDLRVRVQVGLVEVGGGGDN